MANGIQKWLILWVAVLVCQTVLAQKPKSIKPTTDFDQRFSFFNNQSVNIWGYRVGVLVNDSYKVGIGGYFVRQDSQQIAIASPMSNGKKIQRDVYFGTVFYEPFVFRKSWVQMSVVFELGYGNTSIDSAVQAFNGERFTRSQREHIIPVAVGVSYYFKLPPQPPKTRLLNYVGLNIMAGLRTVILSQPTGSNYNGFYWSVGGTLFLDEIYSDYKRKRALRVANSHAVLLRPTP